MFTKLAAKVVGAVFLLGGAIALSPFYAFADGPNAGTFTARQMSPLASGVQVNTSMPVNPVQVGQSGQVVNARYTWSGGSGCCNNFDSEFYNATTNQDYYNPTYTCWVNCASGGFQEPHNFTVPNQRWATWGWLQNYEATTAGNTANFSTT